MNLIDKLSANSITSEFRKKFANVFQNFPFYNFNIQKIKNITSSYRGSFEEYIDSLQDLDKLNKHLLKEVMQVADNKLRIIFPTEKFEELTLLIFFLFMAKSYREEIRKEKKNVLTYLISHSRDTSEVNKYSSGKFSFLIINFLNYICHILLYFPMMITLLQHFDQLNKLQIEKLIVNKIEVNGIKYEELKRYFLEKLEKLNSKIKPEAIMDCCLPFIFEPIKNCKIF